MPQRSLVLASLLAASLVAVHAQKTKNPPPANITIISNASGIGIPDVAGLPFSATAVIENERTLRDGSVLTRRTINLIARDSAGRTRTEMRRLMPESFHGSPELIEVRIFDPQTRIKTIYYPSTHLARQLLLPIPPKVVAAHDRFDSQKDLGTTTLNGVEAKGTLRTLTTFGFLSGTEEVEDVDVVDEIWYSHELHLNLLVHHSDPRSSEQTLGISDLKREEPPAAMFQIPPSYKIVDATPAPGPPPMRDAAADEVP
jgi:hypothetical protein